MPLTRDHLSVISGITPNGRLLLQVQDHAFHSPEVAVFLRHLLRHVPGKLLVIWDGAPIHRGQPIKDFLSQGGARRLRLEQLPGYAPDLNPDEGIWAYLNCVELRNLCCTDLDDLHQRLRLATARLRHKSHVLRGCVTHCGYAFEISARRSLTCAFAGRLGAGLTYAGRSPRREPTRVDVRRVRCEDEGNLTEMSPTRGRAPSSRRAFLHRGLSLVIGTTLLAACGPSSTAQPTSPPAAQPRPTPAPTSAPAAGTSAPVATAANPAAQAPAQSGANLSGSITVSYPDELGKKPPYVQAAADQITKANPNANISIDLQKISSGDYYTKLLLALQSGSGPDVTHVGGDSIGEMVDAGYLAPLDDYLAKWEDWKQYPDAVKQGVSYKGKVYGIPYGLDTRFLYYRKDVFQKAGLQASWQPKNVQDILDTAKQLQAKTPDVIPYVIYAGKAGDTGTANHGFVPVLWAFGGDLQDKSGKWIGQSDALRKAIAYYQQAYVQAKLVPSEVLTTPKPWTAMREKEGKGGLAMLFEGGWVYGGWASNDKTATQQNIGYVLFPTESGGPSFTVGGPGTVWMITSQSKNKDLAWEFIKTWNNRDTVARLNIEDPHPVARTDSADVPEFRADQFLVDSTRSLEKAKFTPVDAAWGKVITAIQAATDRAATGDGTPEDIIKRYADDLRRAVGDDRVTEA